LRSGRCSASRLASVSQYQREPSRVTSIPSARLLGVGVEYSVTVGRCCAQAGGRTSTIPVPRIPVTNQAGFIRNLLSSLPRAHASAHSSPCPSSFQAGPHPSLLGA